MMSVVKVLVALAYRTMVEATLDDRQRLRAANDVFFGRLSHSSARRRSGMRAVGAPLTPPRHSGDRHWHPA